MAGFKTHISVSTALGIGYAGAGYWSLGLPPDTAMVGGALCGFSGMLPDLDSDYGVPLRETMAFTAAVIPMLLVGHFQTFGLSHDSMVLLAVSLYLFVRFGVTKIIRRYTVHRGMFHSIPAGLTFAGLAFLLAATCPIEVRYFKAGGVFAGFMSHLLLDELYSIEWKGGRWKFKRSFGTAVKLWSRSSWSNVSTYGKLVIVAGMIFSESSVREHIEARNPGFAERYQQLQQRFESVGVNTSAANEALDAARAAADHLAVPATAQRDVDSAQRVESR